MKKLALIFTLLSFFYVTDGYSQSYLGKTKSQIIKEAKADYGKTRTAFETINEKLSVIKISNDQETVFLYLVNDVCSEIVVSKRYNLREYSNDIIAFNENFSRIGKTKWISKDLSTVYEINVNQSYYNFSTSFIN